MTGDGRPVPGRLRAALLRELARIELLLQQIADVEAERDVSIDADVDGRPSPVALLARLKAIGPQIGAVLYHEGLYRNFAKPFNIDKKQVYEAYKAVKSKGGAAGEDGQTIEQFEADLKTISTRSGI